MMILSVDATDLSCPRLRQAFGEVDQMFVLVRTADGEFGVPVAGWAEELDWRGEDHVNECRGDCGLNLAVA